MDVARFETLETHVVALVKAFAGVKEENAQLDQSVRQLQEALATQQSELARLHAEREELLQLRTRLQALQQERDIIQQKLHQMLETIEWLEGRTRLEGGTSA